MRAQLIYPIHDAPTKNAHASTLCELPDGTVCAAWFGGTKEKDPDVNIYFSRLQNGVWERPVCVAESPIALWNPALFYYNDTLILYYKEGAQIRFWKTFYMTSKDGGKTFSEPRELVEGDVGGRGPVKNKPIALGQRILAPASIERPMWYAFIDRSDDGGKSWAKSNLIFAADESRETFEAHKNDDLDTTGPIKVPGIIQPTLWADGDDVYALFRSTTTHVMRSVSHDRGETFSQAQPIGVPNNNSGIDAVRLTDGRVALVCNPVGVNHGVRTPISLFISDDNGLTFRKVYDLEQDAGEFSYPAVIEKKGGGLRITYTWRRLSVCYVEVDASEL